MTDDASSELRLIEVERHPQGPGVDRVTIETNRGAIDCRLHDTDQPDAAVVWVGGAGGGLKGPAGGLYPRLASTLQLEGTGSLRVDYRQPSQLAACVLDTLMGVAYLQSLGYQRFILVGHSFGGAVVIMAGVQLDAVVGVATLASQTAGVAVVSDLAPRPIFLAHGPADHVLPVSCSRELYARAKDPRELKLYEGCDHSFEECRQLLEDDLLAWMRGVFAGAGDHHE